MRSLIYLFFIIISACCKAQVYVYEPIRHSNFETNPAFLANQKYKTLAAYTHQGRLPYIPNVLGNFSHDAFKLSYLDKKHFCGLGLFASKTKFNNAASISTIGLGAAYRIIILNKYHARIGGLYKLNYFKNPGGSFSEYKFLSDSTFLPVNNTKSNINASISVSTSSERFFMSFAALNMNIGKVSDQLNTSSPKYYSINIGDLGKLTDNRNNEISFTSIVKVGDTKRTYQQQLNIVMHLMDLSRRASIMYGVVAAYNNDKYFLLRPSLLLYRRERQRLIRTCRPITPDTGVFRIQYDFAVPVDHTTLPFKPSLQISYAKIF